MPSTRTINLLIFLACFGLLGFGYYLEYGQGIEPCPLCLVQRLFFALTGLTCLIAALHNPASLGTKIYGALTALFALAGAAVAGRQVWLQHLPPDQVPTCGPGLEYMLKTYPLGETIAKLFKGSGECAEKGWTFLDLSIAEWALICFAGFVLVSLMQIWRSRNLAR